MTNNTQKERLQSLKGFNIKVYKFWWKNIAYFTPNTIRKMCSPNPREKWLWSNLVPRACDPREGTRGSGIILCRKPGILAKIELRIPFQRPIRFLPETDYPRASRSFTRIAGSGNEIGCEAIRSISYSGRLRLWRWEPTRFLSNATLRSNVDHEDS
jgi:hypothetical protein